VFYCKTKARGKTLDLQETRAHREQNSKHFQTVGYNPRNYVYRDPPKPIFGGDQNLDIRALDKQLFLLSRERFPDNHHDLEVGLHYRALSLPDRIRHSKVQQGLLHVRRAMRHGFHTKVPLEASPL
jgi:hypothetical protein